MTRLGNFVFLGLIYLGWMYRQSLDQKIRAIWIYLRTSWLFQLESFEPLLVICSFAVFIGAFNLLDLFIIENDVPSHMSNRAGPNQADSPSVLIRFASRFNHYRIEPELLPSKLVSKKHLFRFSALKKVVLYLTPIVALDIAWPRRVLSVEPPSFLGLVGQVMSALFIYDSLFTICHLWLHKSKAKFHQIHAKHHRHLRIQAMDTINLSLVEATSEVLFSIFALNIVGCHPLARVVYDILIVYLLVEIHSGYDFPFNLANLVPLGLFSGPREHYLHHRYGNVHYHKFFSCLNFLGMIA